MILLKLDVEVAMRSGRVLLELANAGRSRRANLGVCMIVDDCVDDWS